MFGWLIFAAYVVGFLPTWRRAAWVVSSDFGYHGSIDGEDIAMGIFIGALIALAWPILVPAYIAYQHGKLYSAGHGFLKPPKHEREAARIRALEEERREKDYRIKQLERELGIGAR